MLRDMRRGRIGRWLCARGWHKWEQKTAVDQVWEDDRIVALTVTDYAWCKDDTCPEPTRIVNVERRAIT